MRPVLGAQNPRIAELRRLIGRRSSRSDTVVVEGLRTINEALDVGVHPQICVVAERDALRGEVIQLEERLGDTVEWLVVRDHVFDRLAPATSPQPVLAIVERPVGELGTLAGDAVVLVLADVGDPGNCGTLIRSAVAVGADAVVVVGGADPYGPKVMRSSAGLALRIPIVQRRDLGDAIDELRAAGLRVVGTDVNDGEPHDGGVLAPPVAVVMGAESSGLAKETEVDAWTTIATDGAAESLNVAMAATLLMFETRRK